MPKMHDMIETWRMVSPWSKNKETGAIAEGMFEAKDAGEQPGNIWRLFQ